MKKKRGIWNGLARFLKRTNNNALTIASRCGHAISVSYNKRRGTTSVRRDRELIVSITTIPERIRLVHLCLDCLLRQSIQPDRIVLWLNECDSPGRPVVMPCRLPENLKRLVARGLEIRWCKNIGPYCKIIPTLREFPDAIIVTADDDILYPATWLEELYNTYIEDPSCIPCHRAHLMTRDTSGNVLPYMEWDIESPDFAGPSLDLFPTGVGGVLYAPHHLNHEVVNEEVFSSICPKADDVWLKAMSLMNHTRCKRATKHTFRIINNLRQRGAARLYDFNIVNNGNDAQIQNLAKRYGVFTQKDNATS
jgi:hypothetical protein